MLTYWLMFLLPAWACITVAGKPKPSGKNLETSWLIVGVLLTLLIGLRHQVGGDWGTYERHYLDMVGAPLSVIFEKGDPGYYLLNWLSGQVEGGIYLVNLVCGTLLSVGLIAFCRQQPRPWLALSVAMPYLVIVVGMGYSRQGVALGLAMLGMAGLAKKNNRQFVVCVALAATFHKSAVVMIPLAILATPRSRIWTGMWVGVAASILYTVLLADNVDGLVTNYIDAQYQSDGAAVRIAMNALPALVLLVLRKRFVWVPAERNLWVIIALLALASVGWLMVSASSTAVDRMALYLIPLQMFVFARLPDLMGWELRNWVMAVVAYYTVVLFVWLNFATYAYLWMPYNSWLFL